MYRHLSKREAPSNLKTRDFKRNRMSLLWASEADPGGNLPWTAAAGSRSGISCHLIGQGKTVNHPTAFPQNNFCSPALATLTRETG